MSGQRIIDGLKAAVALGSGVGTVRVTLPGREAQEMDAATFVAALRIGELEKENVRLRDALTEARDLIADQLDAPHHLATIDAALAAPSAE
jgi:hypothetical protein